MRALACVCVCGWFCLCSLCGQEKHATQTQSRPVGKMADAFRPPLVQMSLHTPSLCFHSLEPYQNQKKKKITRPILTDALCVCSCADGFLCSSAFILRAWRTFFNNTVFVGGVIYSSAFAFCLMFVVLLFSLFFFFFWPCGYLRCCCYLSLWCSASLRVFVLVCFFFLFVFGLFILVFLLSRHRMYPCCYKRSSSKGLTYVADCVFLSICGSLSSYSSSARFLDSL